MEEWFTRNSETILDDLFTFLRFKTIATDPKYHRDCEECAVWLAFYLSDIGMEAKTIPTSGQPVVFASYMQAGEDKPTLMIYQHYDVQPVDPIELWQSDPFEPEVRDGQVFARGAQDNKGQCFYTITALKALLEQEIPLDFNIKLFIEGEEESGSIGTREVLGREELKSDYLLVPDASIPAPNQPAISLGVRGIQTMEMEVVTADTDIHSGWGGIPYNAIRALTHALDACYDDSGKVAIPGFYDAVKELTDEEKKSLDFHCDEKSMRQNFGLRAVSPEPGYSLGESASARPTFEINGIQGGYTGKGFKTVLPARANAKISCRLVPDQDPDHIFSCIEKHLRAHLPEGVEMTLTTDHGSPAFRSSPDSLIAKRTSLAYEEVMGKPCKAILSGGSIPITVELVNATGAEGLVMGVGLDTDNIHAPNEHFGLDRFEQGFLIMGNILKSSR